MFAAGGVRGWSRLAGGSVSSVLCRETLDGDGLLPEWRAGLPPAGLRLLLWPSFIGASDAEQAALTQAYRRGACSLAAALQAWVLQSNWPVSLNAPQARGLGAGVIVAPGGNIVAELAADAPGLWCLELPQPPSGSDEHRLSRLA